MPHDSHDPSGDDAPRLQKYLSACGVASRRHSEVLIRQGRVTVDGEPATLGMRVPAGAVVRVDGVPVGEDAPRYIMLNKPAGVITTADDPQGRQTVTDLVDSGVRVYPVGRLDADTTGLLLLTNDGELAHRLMHPSYGVEKTYRVLVSGTPKAADVRRLAEGVELDDGVTSPAQARVLSATQGRALLELTIHEGKNRQVRRMCEAIGCPVRELTRVRYGPLALGDLRMSAWRDCTAAEVRRLYKATGMQRPRRDARDSD